MLPLLDLVLLEHPGLEREALPLLILHRCGLVTILGLWRNIVSKAANFIYFPDFTFLLAPSSLAELGLI